MTQSIPCPLTFSRFSLIARYIPVCSCPALFMGACCFCAFDYEPNLIPFGFWGAGDRKGWLQVDKASRWAETCSQATCQLRIIHDKHNKLQNTELTLQLISVSHFWTTSDSAPRSEAVGTPEAAGVM